MSFAAAKLPFANSPTRPQPVTGDGPLHGKQKVAAAILGRPVIENILTHAGLNPQPPPLSPMQEPGRKTYATSWDTSVLLLVNKCIPVRSVRPHSRGENHATTTMR